MQEKHVTKQLSNVLSDDINELLNLASRKGLNCIIGVSNKIARLDSLCAYEEINKANLGSYYLYTDATGAMSKEAKDIIIAINVRIKSAFGFGVSHNMSELQSSSIAMVRKEIAKAMTNGVKNKLLKCEIRGNIYKIIYLHAELYLKMEEMQ